MSTAGGLPIQQVAATLSTIPAPAPSALVTYAEYWAAQPSAVQALQNMDPELRPAAALKLAQQGYTIDVPIMVWNWPPLQTMMLRQDYGYTWVPGALGSPVTVPPGVNYPGGTAYDAGNPPPGSIKVSVLASDYPAFSPPPPPPAPPSNAQQVVELPAEGPLYYAGPAANNLKDLDQVRVDVNGYASATGTLFTFHKTVEGNLGMGSSEFFTQG